MGSIRIVIRSAMTLTFSLLGLPTLVRFGRVETDEAVRHHWAPTGARDSVTHLLEESPPLEAACPESTGSTWRSEAIQEARAGAAPAAERPAAQPDGVPDGAQGLRILLAEDSQDNVLLIQSYLEASGCSADVAGNGEVALRKFISGTYDIVLMAVQMPVMDGYAATRKIRQWEGENGTTPVPILALTAHALPEEVRKSLDAGCTTHLTKPIQRATLLRAIEEHTTGVVRVDAGLAELVPGFLENRRTDLAAIASALARADYGHVRILGHNMKGSGASYGFKRITELGASLERAAGRCDSEEIRARAAELSRYLDGLHVKYE